MMPRLPDPLTGFHDAGSLVRIFAVLRGKWWSWRSNRSILGCQLFPLINFQGFQVTTPWKLGDLFKQTNGGGFWNLELAAISYMFVGCLMACVNIIFKTYHVLYSWNVPSPRLQSRCDCWPFIAKPQMDLCFVQKIQPETKNMGIWGWFSGCFPETFSWCSLVASAGCFSQAFEAICLSGYLFQR